MRVGTQIITPEGWASLTKGTTYHLLRNDASNGRVLIVHFHSPKTKGQPKANLLSMPRRVFEEGVVSEKIIPAAQQSVLPPWLQALEGLDLTQLDKHRPNAKISYATRVEDRYLLIATAVRNIDSILSAQDPQAEINRYARECSPCQNESRFRLWLLTYFCFGQDVWALLPSFHHIGHWDRGLYPERKFGAPSLAYGKHYGNGSSKEMIEACTKSYLKRAKLGKFMSTIYAEAMIQDFGCIVVKNDAGFKTYIHPQGKPFPTENQFKYRIKKGFGLEEIQKSLYGAARHRNRIARSKGRYSEEIANLMERVEADGYYTERPKGYIDGSSLPPMCVVTSSDLLSGLKLGIGFSFGKERSTAYRMMLFSMAVPKDFFCSIFGIPYVEDEWPSEGLPGHLTIDRGPGARKDLIEALEKRFLIRGMVPSWSGQSKATVETSHPWETKLDGEPTFIQSGLTPVELAKREIMRLIQFNNGANMEGRFDPDSALAFVTPSPVGLWNHYDKLFRNDAQSIRIDEAIRTFLTPTEFQVKEDGIYLQGRMYTSTELDESGLLDGPIKSNSTFRVPGYVLDMCVRHAWIELDGKLFMLDAKLRIRGDEETLWMSIAELNQWSDARRTIHSAYRLHQKANTSDYRQRFEENTGKAWDVGQRRFGNRPKRKAA